MIVVNKGAIPEKPTRGRPRKYPLDVLSVGQYFDVPQAGNTYQVLHACCRYFVRTQCGADRCIEFQIDKVVKGRQIMLRVTRIR